MQPTLLISLIAYFVYNMKGKFNRMAWWLLAGLCIDCCSDIILTFYKDEFNLPSMLGYFAGHICFGMAFITSTNQSGYKVSLINRFIFSLPPIFYILVYYLFIFNYINTHEVKSYYIIPTTLYSFSIIFMATTALWRMGTTNESSYWCIASGALLYMLSDSVTGYDHFIAKIDMRYLASMFTYGASLFLFAIGTILHRPFKKRE